MNMQRIFTPGAVEVSQEVGPLSDIIRIPWTRLIAVLGVGSSA